MEPFVYDILQSCGPHLATPNLKRLNYFPNEHSSVPSWFLPMGLETLQIPERNVDDASVRRIFTCAVMVNQCSSQLKKLSLQAMLENGLQNENILLKAINLMACSQSLTKFDVILFAVQGKTPLRLFDITELLRSLASLPVLKTLALDINKATIARPFKLSTSNSASFKALQHLEILSIPIQILDDILDLVPLNTLTKLDVGKSDDSSPMLWQFFAKMAAKSHQVVTLGLEIASGFLFEDLRILSKISQACDISLVISANFHLSASNLQFLAELRPNATHLDISSHYLVQNEQSHHTITFSMLKVFAQWMPCLEELTISLPIKWSQPQVPGILVPLLGFTSSCLHTLHLGQLRTDDANDQLAAAEFIDCLYPSLKVFKGKNQDKWALL